jgi:hypothetical protein
MPGSRRVLTIHTSPSTQPGSAAATGKAASAATIRDRHEEKTAQRGGDRSGIAVRVIGGRLVSEWLGRGSHNELPPDVAVQL